MCQDYFKYDPMLNHLITTLNVPAEEARLAFDTGIRFFKSGMVLTKFLRTRQGISGL